MTDAEKALYSWQLDVAGFGDEGQRRLKQSSVLVSRCGGVGGHLAAELAMAGVGTLVLAHAGNLRLDDLNRQVLMSHTGLNTPRAPQAAERLRALNPYTRVEAFEENVTPENVKRLVTSVDAVASCAPLFEERLLLNQEAVRQKKPLVDCAMFELEAQLVTVFPGKTACLACLYPAPPPAWQRRFPVLGAVAGVIGCLGALELIKLLSGLASPLENQLLLCDLRTLAFRRTTLLRRPDCLVCGK
ncbi:MAG: HesA/MoeB/ThiF family protein [Gemmataceae bacterium]|nr:HesA/MoeB/ThiF family protein [Gemmataceae bacterium]MCI0741245.1 HesA/MoeB/ThiF family protein [Gemmataceae bacterium]